MNKNFINDLRSRGRSAESSTGVTQPRQRGGKRRLVLWIIAAVVVILVLGIVVATMRATATVKVTPVQQIVMVDHIIAGLQRGAEGTGLPFDRESVTESDTASVPASGIRNVIEKAKGMITIENRSDKVQRFVPRTRFQSAQGQIYRTQSAVVIAPAKKSGTAILPGITETTVIADLAGEKANLEAGASFAVPGLKGGVLYAQVSAKAKTAINGGFSGAKKIASLDEIKTTEDTIKNSLSARLVQKLKTAVPDDDMLYDDAIFTTFAITNADSPDKNTYSENITGTMTAFLFKKADLTKTVAERTTSDNASSSVDAIGLDKLTFRILGKSNIDPSVDSHFSFSLQGSLKLVWQYDRQMLAQALAGVPRDRYQEVFRRFPTIERAEATFRPKWRQTFPADPQKITIESVLTQ